MTRIPRRTRALSALAAITLLGVAVTGCSSGGSNDASSDPAAADKAASGLAPNPSAERNAATFSEAYGGDGSDGLTSLDLQTAARPPENTPAKKVISTGNVALKSDDVAQARFDVQKVVDKYRGEVSQEQTDTDDDGDIRHSRLVVRIPTADFADAMKDLEGAADLIYSDTNTDDVTTKVIDNQVRLRVQRRSIARIELLLDRAQSIRDIVNIESQLSQRQAELGSLERQHSYLADQTRMSTVTISLERTAKKKVVEKKKDKDTTGFAAGLSAGWNGLSNVTTGLLTVTGALLPFAVVMLLLAIPGWPLLRRLRRRRTVLAQAQTG